MSTWIVNTMSSEGKKVQAAKGGACQEFAPPEYMPRSRIRFYNSIGSKFQKMFFHWFSKSLGCKGRLDTKPYETFVKGV